MTAQNVPSQDSFSTQADAVRQFILGQAASLFRSNGYKSTSLGEIAQAVGRSKAGLYHYFPSKEDILVGIAHAAIDSLIEQLNGALSKNISLEEQLKELVVGRVEVIAQEQDAMATFWQERTSLPEDLYGGLVQRMSAYLDEILTLLGKCQKSGIIQRDQDIQMVMLALIGMTGWSYLWYRPGGRLSAREIGEAFWCVFWEGVRA